MAATEYDFILTRNELIEESYRKIGVFAENQVLSAYQVSTANNKLNMILKSWSDDGVHLWTNVTATITTVDGTSSYSVPTTDGMSFVDQAVIIESDNRLELDRMSYTDYQTYCNITKEGKPTAFHHRKSDNKIYLVPVPNQAWTIEIIGIKPLKDWETSSSTGEFPSKWLNAIKYALAVDLGEDYKLPLKELAYLRTLAREEKLLARGKELDPSSYNPCVTGAY